MKRIISAAMAVVLTLLFAVQMAGCDSATPSATPAPTIPPFIDSTFVPRPVFDNVETIVFHINSQRLPDEPLLSEWLANFNDTLAMSGIPAEVAIATNTMQNVLPMPEGVDVFRINNLVAYKQMMVSEGLLADLTDELSARPELYNTSPESVWNTFAVDGRIYAFPLLTSSMFNGIPESSLLIRTDVLEELGASPPTTWEDLVVLAEQARDKGLDYSIAYPFNYPPYALHRTYDEWPFYVDPYNAALFDAYGGVRLYVDSEVYVNDMRIIHETKEKGVMKFIAPEEVEDFRTNGKDFFAAMFPVISLTNDSPYHDLVSYVPLMPDKPTFRMRPDYDGYLYIPATVSEERLSLIMDVLEAMYTNSEVYDAFVYGIKNENYQIDDDGIVTLNDGPHFSTYRHGALDRNVAGVFSELHPDVPPVSSISFPAGTFEPSITMNVMQEYLESLFKWNSFIRMRSGINVKASDEAYQSLLNDLNAEAYMAELREQYADYLGN